MYTADGRIRCIFSANQLRQDLPGKVDSIRHLLYLFRGRYSIVGLPLYGKRNLSAIVIHSYLGMNIVIGLLALVNRCCTSKIPLLLVPKHLGIEIYIV